MHSLDGMQQFERLLLEMVSALGGDGVSPWWRWCQLLVEMVSALGGDGVSSWWRWWASLLGMPSECLLLPLGNHWVHFPTSLAPQGPHPQAHFPNSQSGLGTCQSSLPHKKSTCTIFTSCGAMVAPHGAMVAPPWQSKVEVESK